MTENIKQLLKAVADINKKYDTIASATGSNFNVFDSLEATKELDICRILYVLLNPKGSHGQGAVFLEAFFDTVLTDIDVDKFELDKAVVTREHVIDNQRRIDIYIETKSWAIPIEVKINALDQESQCFDYQRYAKRQKKNYRLYYLTPTARELSNESAVRDELLIERECLSYITFGEDILRWLEFCVSHIAIRLAPIREVLLQYMAVIRKFSNKLENNIMNDIAKTIMLSSENIKSAKNIAESLDACRRKIMSKLFSEIEKMVAKAKIINEDDWEYRDVHSIDNYPKKGCLPGISYHLKDFKAKGKNVSVWVRCEIDYNLFVGLCVTIDGDACENKSKFFNKDDLIKYGIQTDEECKHEFFNYEWAKPNWWLFWDYIYVQSGEVIDFRSANTAAYYSLFDAKGFEYVVQNCVNAINDFLSRK